MSDTTFDIIVIGAGSGGLNIAGFMNKAGFSVLLIDKSDKNIGGDCLNFGCVPSKALIHVAREINAGRNARKFGLSVSGEADMRRVKKYIKERQNIIREHENADHFRAQGMTVVLGDASFISKNEVHVNGQNYKGKKIVIATGSRPRTIEIPGIEKTPVYTNETIFDLERLPRSLLIIGAGPIGLELGQAFNYLGSKVTILQRGSGILPKEDPEIAKILLERLKGEGIEFYFKCKEKNFIAGDKIIVESNGKQEQISFDAVLVAVGRELNIEGLDLEKAEIEMDGRKIKVNEYLQTTNNRVYLCGDVAGNFQFTHAAEVHAGVILQNFFSPFKKKLNMDSFAWVTYTNPEIATFGLNEEGLRKRGDKYRVLETDFKDDDRAIVDDYIYGKLKIFISGRGAVLGGTMIAPNAGELFQEFVLLHSSGLSISALSKKVYPYPTAARINKRIAMNYMAEKMTKNGKRILKFLYH